MIDSQPRIISNLVADQNILTNPAAHAVDSNGDGTIPNTPSDGGAPFNQWFALFGQFFDHGLDLVAKGGSGTVFVPLQPDDPLYVEGSDDELHGSHASHQSSRSRRAALEPPMTFMSRQI